jgi:hypothetical protein
MTDDLIQLPNIAEIKEMIAIAKQDVESEIQQDPELRSASELLLNVINVIDTKLTKSKNFDNLSNTEKIDIAAHLNFLQNLLEDFFMFDEDYEDESFDFEDDGEQEYK